MAGRDGISPPVKWHPILSLREYRTGQWALVVYGELTWALISLVRRGDELAYKVTSVALEESARELHGYRGNLRAAAELAQQTYLSTLSPHVPDPLSGHRNVYGAPLEPHRAPGKANTPAHTERD